MWVALVVTLTLSASFGADARRKRRSRSKAKPAASVAHRTASRAYFKVGSRRGVQEGTNVQLLLGRNKVGTCAIDRVSTSRASCALSSGIEEGKLNYRLVDAGPIPTRVEKQLDQRAPQKSAPVFPTSTAFKKVPYEATARTERARLIPRSEVGMQVSAWMSGLEPSRGHLRGTMYATISGAQLYVPGLRLHARIQVHGVTQVATRFRPADPIRLEVHELAIAYRQRGQLVSGALGRIRPRGVSGTPVVDGAQAGVHLLDGDVEVGVYGGLIPTQLELAPQFANPVVGLYWAVQKSFASFLVQSSGNLSSLVATTPGFGAIVSGETHSRIDTGRFLEVSAGVRASASVDAPNVSLDVGYLQATTRPLDGFRLNASYRFRGQLLNTDPLTQLPGIEAGYHHAALGVGWDQLQWLSLRLQTIASGVVDQSALRVALAPEIGFPQLLGNRVSIFVGGAEFFGTQAGRNVYVRSSIAPFHGTFIQGRLFYVDTAASPEVFRAGGTDFTVRQRLFERFSIWGSARVESAIPSFHASVLLEGIQSSAQVGASATF